MDGQSALSRAVDPQTFAKQQQALLEAEHEAEVASSTLGASGGSATTSASAATRRLLQAAGLALTGLVLVNSRTGMGGREIGEFGADAAVSSTTRRSGSASVQSKVGSKDKGSPGTRDSGAAATLGPHGIRVGDVVRVSDIAGGSRGSKKGRSTGNHDGKDRAGCDGEQGLEGVVTRVGERGVWIAFGASSSSTASADDSVSVTDYYGKKLWLVKLANDVTYRRMNQTMAKLSILPPSSYSHLLQVLLGQARPAPPDGAFASCSDLHFHDPSLNDSQKEAIRFALASRDIALIHGPPGTGKTHTLIELIRQFLSRGQKVLVCGPSNISVDNIVERLAVARVPVIRLGHPARLLDSVVSHSLEVVTQTSDAGEIVKDVKKEIDEKYKAIRKTKAYREKRQIYADIRDLRKEYRTREAQCTQSLIQASSVIAATLHGAGGYQLRGQEAQKFDAVIVDEASQALEAQCWVPLLQLARTPTKLILAGDHLQLPPTVLSSSTHGKSAQATRRPKSVPPVTNVQGSHDPDLSLEVTLFDRLLALHGDQYKRMLTTQYRMNEHIMAFPSQELYEGKLVAAEHVKRRVLSDLTLAEISSDLSRLAVTESVGQAVRSTDDTSVPLIFYDTQGGDFPEDEDTALNDADSRLKSLLGSDSKANTHEALIAKRHILRLVEAGVPACDIAAISPYNAQVSLLARLLREDERTAEVEIGSIDGFQGREKEAVVVSLVRSNDRGEVGFLSEKRRLNVAMTRPRRQLCVIGDSETIAK
ncbi:hypothetical protein KEM52_003486 [Ascosphaera acerosa]|nr:hypothetical protein KEM52_003486 [Ascosphaera acerosa]